MLRLIDTGLIYTGAVLVPWFVIWLVFRRRRDPLSTAPTRANVLGVDAVQAAVLAYLVGFLLAAALTGGLDGDHKEQDSLSTLSAANAAQVAGLIACLHFVRRDFEGGLQRFLFGRLVDGARRTILFTVVGTFLALSCCPAILEATVRALRWLAPTYALPEHTTLQALRDDAQPLSIVVTLWAGALIVAPLAEEVFFRGILQNILVYTLGSGWRAVAWSAIAFGLVHLAQPQVVPPLIVLGLILGVLYERTGSLLAPIAVHVLFNLKSLVWEALT